MRFRIKPVFINLRRTPNDNVPFFKIVVLFKRLRYNWMIGTVLNILLVGQAPGFV